MKKLTYIHSVQRKININFFGFILKYLAATGRGQIAGKLMRKQLVQLKQPKTHNYKTITALILPKPGFSEDIQASLCSDTRFKVLAIDRAYTKFVYSAFLPKTVDDNNYRTAPPKTAEGKRRLREFWHAAWPHISRGEISVLLTGNFSYHAEQEMTAAIADHGVSVVALHKECLKSPSLENFYERVYRERKIPFQGRLILTYNKIEYDIQVKAGTIRSERIQVTGMARLDRIHKWRETFGGSVRKTGTRPTVLFMSFTPHTGTPLISRKLPGKREILDNYHENINWKSLVVKCHAAIAKMAEQQRDIDIIVKAKDHGRALEVIQQSFGPRFHPPENLKIIVGGDPFSLITRADVLCGFNSSSLFEALAANVPVVSPCFAEAAEEVTKGYVIDLQDAAAKAHSPEELIEVLSKKARESNAAGHATILGYPQKYALDYWLGNSDGQSGARISDIVHEIGMSQHGNISALPTPGHD